MSSCIEDGSTLFSHSSVDNIHYPLDISELVHYSRDKRTFLGVRGFGRFLAMVFCPFPRQVFDTEALMREHWKDCHGIQVEDIILPMLVPDMLKEPGMNRLNVQGVSGTQSSTPGPSGPQGGVPGPSGVTPARPGTDPGLARRTQKLNRQEVKRIAKEEKRLRLEREGKPAEAPEAPSDPKSDSNSSETPMESETPVEPAQEGAGGKILFTGGKPDEYELDVDVLELDKKLREYEKN